LRNSLHEKKEGSDVFPKPVERELTVELTSAKIPAELVDRSSEDAGNVTERLANGCHESVSPDLPESVTDETSLHTMDVPRATDSIGSPAGDTTTAAQSATVAREEVIGGDQIGGPSAETVTPAIDVTPPPTQAPLVAPEITLASTEFLTPECIPIPIPDPPGGDPGASVGGSAPL
jgi:hypothetical protein